MNIAIMKTDLGKNTVINVAIFDDLKTAKDFFKDGVWDDIGADSVADLPEGFGIGDTYENKKWVKAPQPEPEEFTGTVSYLNGVPDEIMTLLFIAEAQRDDSIFGERILLNNMFVFAKWDEFLTVMKGTIIRDDGALYKAINDIDTPGVNTKPSTHPLLWSTVANPAIEYPEWKNPLGAHDTYMKGSKVTYNGKKYVSDIDNNIWRPDNKGWTEIK